MAGKRRGRTGRGWDAAPPQARRGIGQRADRVRATTAEHTDGSTPEDRELPEQAPYEQPREPPQEFSRDPAELAREICLRQLAVRPRTRAELATALRRRGIADRTAAEVLDRYDDVGLIDDAAFARAWITSRHHGRGLASRALGSELRRRGVAAETVGEALGSLDAETEAATARALVDRRLRTVTGTPEAIVRRMVGMLARKGYPAGLAYRVVKDALADDARTAELADRLDPDALGDAAAGEDPLPGHP